jgi:predicted transposase YbfD/YdcC
LALNGSTVTIDAMGCQTAIAQAIVNEKANYILAVKGNHKSLHEPITEVFNLAQNKKFNKKLISNIYKHEVTGEHGRIEERIIRSLPVETIDTQLDLNQWAGIKTIIQIEHTNHTINTVEYRYYISSIADAEVERLAKSIRSHWMVENNLHWVLDVVFREDDCRVRDEIAVQNLSWIRKIALFFLKHDTSKMSIRRKMLKYWATPQGLTTLITNN